MASLVSFFANRDINLSNSVSYVDNGNLFVRLTWNLDNHWEDCESFNSDFVSLANDYSGFFDVRFSNIKQSVGLFVGSESHSFIEFINRYMTDEESNISIPFIIGSDDRIRRVADRYGLPFFHVEVDSSSAESVISYEKKQLSIVTRYKPDCLAFANYETILSPEFIYAIDCPMIKAQRTFMPHFEGVNALSKAHKKGVKLVGATAYFVSNQSSIGPIIEQGTIKLKDDFTLAGFIKQSCQIEQTVFVDAIAKVLEHKTIIHNKRAISFS